MLSCAGTAASAALTRRPGPAIVAGEARRSGRSGGAEGAEDGDDAGGAVRSAGWSSRPPAGSCGVRRRHGTGHRVKATAYAWPPAAYTSRHPVENLPDEVHRRARMQEGEPGHRLALPGRRWDERHLIAEQLIGPPASYVVSRSSRGGGTAPPTGRARGPAPGSRGRGSRPRSAVASADRRLDRAGVGVDAVHGQREPQAAGPGRAWSGGRRSRPDSTPPDRRG